MSISKHFESLEYCRNVGAFFTNVINMAKNKNNHDMFTTSSTPTDWKSKYKTKVLWEVSYTIATNVKIKIKVDGNTVTVLGPQTIVSECSYWARKVRNMIMRLHKESEKKAPNEQKVEVTEKDKIAEFAKKYEMKVSNNRITEVSNNRLPHYLHIKAPEDAVVKFLYNVSPQLCGDFTYNFNNGVDVFFEKEEDLTLVKISLDQIK